MLENTAEGNFASYGSFKPRRNPSQIHHVKKELVHCLIDWEAQESIEGVQLREKSGDRD